MKMSYRKVQDNEYNINLSGMSEKNIAKFLDMVDRFEDVEYIIIGSDPDNDTDNTQILDVEFSRKDAEISWKNKVKEGFKSVGIMISVPVTPNKNMDSLKEA
jgi:hypothetical protein